MTSATAILLNPTPLPTKMAWICTTFLMSNNALASIEEDIAIKFPRFSEAVISEDLETVLMLADEIIVLLGDRNRKCKLLKCGIL